MRRLTFDAPDVSWERLRRTVALNDLALFLGAGVSYRSQVPDWAGFVAALGGWSNAQMQRFRAEGLSLISLCEIARRRSAAAKWPAKVRNAIYARFVDQAAGKGLSLADFGSKELGSRRRVSEFFGSTNPVLWAMVRACSIGAEGHFSRNPAIGALLTTNVDGLPQICDRALHGSPRILRTVERASAEQDAEKIPLYQLHGYVLPEGDHSMRRGEAADGLVLTEGDYVARTDDPYSWANVTLHWAVREFRVVFAGCSMNDDLVRRALHRSCRERSEHYAAKTSRRAVDESVWRRHFVVMRSSDDAEIDKTRNESAAMLGLWPLWVRDYEDDLPARVGAMTLRR